MQNKNKQRSSAFIEKFPNKYKSQQESITTLSGKVPPHSNEAEIAVLGSMMLDRMAITKAEAIISSESFYNEAHRVIYETCLNLNNKGIPVDIITLAEELKKNDILEFIGGTYYLTEINAKTPTAANVEHHARIVREKHLKRRLIDSAGTILENGYDESSDIENEIDNAQRMFFEIAEMNIKKDAVDFRQLMKETLKQIHQLKNRDHDGLSGIPSGFIELDNMLGGFQRSDFIIIAGRPSMGKTALALSMARNIAVEYKKTVAFFSIEMKNTQLAIRLISAEAKIDQHKIRTGKISQQDEHKIVNALNRITEAPFIIDDSAVLTISEMRAKCRRLKSEKNIDAVFVDYLQLIQSPKSESREREISIISQSMKSIAKELNIPVIALAQLNRSVESRTDKKPMLSDLRESGSIEQDADVVLFVNRPDFYNKGDEAAHNSEESIGEIIIGKQRNGPTGIVKVAFIKKFARFENLSSYEEPQYASRDYPEPDIESDSHHDDPGF